MMTPSDPQLEIVHEDPDFVLVNKPSGVLSVPGRGPEKADSIVSRVRARFPKCHTHPAVHRLDMDTSGLQLLSLNAEAHRNLSRQFELRQTRKRYVALLEGLLEDEQGTIELPFRLDVENRPIQIYDEVHGKLGVTHWQRVAIEGAWTRVSFVPVTGRTHQLRVHSAHPKGLGIPIVGDPFYGSGRRPDGMKLHATELGFHHPQSGDWLEFESPPPF